MEIISKKTISFELALKDGATTVAAGNLVLKAEDGSTYAVAAANKVAKEELSGAIKTELAKDAAFAANFKVVEPGTADGTLEFTAINAGANGAELLSMNQAVTAAATGNTVNTAIKAFIGSTNGTDGASTAVD